MHVPYSYESFQKRHPHPPPLFAILCMSQYAGALTQQPHAHLVAISSTSPHTVSSAPTQSSRISHTCFLQDTRYPSSSPSCSGFTQYVTSLSYHPSHIRPPSLPHYNPCRVGGEPSPSPHHTQTWNQSRQLAKPRDDAIGSTAPAPVLKRCGLASMSTDTFIEP
jgi:hypothetical protein